MIKFIILLTFVSLVGCSSIWHNRDYIAQRPVETCPASHLPYVLDAVGAVGFGTGAAVIHTTNLDLPQEINVRAMALSFGIISVVYLTSMIMGIGEVYECDHK